MNGVQFDESRLPQPVRPQPSSRGLAQWLVRHHLVQTAAQANIVLMVLAIIALFGVAGAWLFGMTTPKAVVEYEQRSVTETVIPDADGKPAGALQYGKPR